MLSVVHKFDVDTWLESLQKVTKSFDLEKRAHIGAAYKGAVSIYVLRAAPTEADSASPHEALVADILHHLSFIAPDDFFFKATCWPTFIAGAETNHPHLRTQVIKRFEQGLISLPWGYLAKAVEILRDIWSIRDNGARMDWLADLKASQVDVLIA